MATDDDRESSLWDQLNDSATELDPELLIFDEDQLFELLVQYAEEIPVVQLLEFALQRAAAHLKDELEREADLGERLRMMSRAYSARELWGLMAIDGAPAEAASVFARAVADHPTLQHFCR